jgi:alkylhydroperoxidase family enzyme
MEKWYPPKLRRAVAVLFNNPAECTPSLRQAIASHASNLSVGTAETQEIPAALVNYVNKVALHAYKVTDQDVQQLKEAGYSEDAIFEITLCASMGASLARFERGLIALKGEHHASKNS